MRETLSATHGRIYGKKGSRRQELLEMLFYWQSVGDSWREGSVGGILREGLEPSRSRIGRGEEGMRLKPVFVTGEFGSWNSSRTDRGRWIWSLLMLLVGFISFPVAMAFMR
jgi:hypothetical protein